MAHQNVEAYRLLISSTEPDDVKQHLADQYLDEMKADGIPIKKIHSDVFAVVLLDSERKFANDWLARQKNTTLNNPLGSFKANKTLGWLVAILVGLLFFWLFGGWIAESFTSYLYSCYESGSVKGVACLVLTSLLLTCLLGMIAVRLEVARFLGPNRSKTIFNLGVTLTLLLGIGLLGRSWYLGNWNGQQLVDVINPTPVPPLKEDDQGKNEWPWGSKVLAFDWSNVSPITKAAITDKSQAGIAAYYNWAVKNVDPSYTFQNWEVDQLRKDLQVVSFSASDLRVEQKRLISFFESTVIVNPDGTISNYGKTLQQVHSRAKL